VDFDFHCSFVVICEGKAYRHLIGTGSSGTS